MRVTVHIPDTVGSNLKQAARNEGISLSALTAKALESYLRRGKKRQAGMAILSLISSNAVASDAGIELENGRVDDRT